MKPSQIGLSTIPNVWRSHIRLWSPVSRSLRLQLIADLVFSAALAVIIFSLTAHPSLAVTNGIDDEVAHANAVALELISHVNDPFDDAVNNEYFERLADYYHVRIALIKGDGTVVGRSANFIHERVDLPWLQSVLSGSYQAGPFYRLTPFPHGGGDFLILTIGQPKRKLVAAYGGDVTLATIYACVAFMVLFLALIRPKLRYIEQLATGVRELAHGDLSLRVPEKGHDELALLAQSFNHTTTQLQEMIEAERRVELAKGELITNLSHDLRTPLTTIMGYLRLLVDGRYENDQQHKRYLEITYAQTERLKSLLDSLFEYTVLTSSSRDLPLAEVNMTEMVRQLADEWVPVCAENQLELVCEIEPISLMVEINPDIMVRALENILSNAVRYSPKPGTVRIALEHYPSGARLVIANKGEPIAKDDLAMIFERFRRLDASRGSDTGGSGLGLAIAKSIIEMHAGTVWAECEDGWISFVIQIPCIE